MSSVKHARYSPSKLEALERCLKFGYKDSDSEAASEGTEMHEALATGILAGLNEEQKNQVTAVQQYIDNTKMQFKNVQEFRELKVEVPDLTYGTADIVLICDNVEAIVLDAKFGRKGATDAKDNFQVACYCCAVMEANPAIQKVTGGILAPRVNDITTHVFTRDDIPRIRGRIETLYERLADPFAAPTPDEDLCALCKHAGRCPALGKLVKVTAEGLGLPVPSAFRPEALTAPEDRAIGQMLAGAFENWSEQVKAGNLEFVRGGGEIPGFKLVSRSTGARVPKEHTLIAYENLKAQGYTESALLSAMTLSIPELAKAEAASNAGDEAVEKGKIQELLGELVQVGSCSYLTKDKKKKGGPANKQLMEP